MPRRATWERTAARRRSLESAAIWRWPAMRLAQECVLDDVAQDFLGGQGAGGVDLGYALEMREEIPAFAPALFVHPAGNGGDPVVDEMLQLAILRELDIKRRGMILDELPYGALQRTFHISFPGLTGNRQFGLLVPASREYFNLTLLRNDRASGFARANTMIFGE